MEYQLVKKHNKDSWYIYYREPAHEDQPNKTIPRWISTGEKDETRARKYLDGLINGKSGVPSLRLHTVEDVLHEYTLELTNRKTLKKNLKRHNSIVKVLSNYFGDTNIEELNRRATKQYIRSREVAPQSASRELDVLRAALNFCKDEELIEWVPFRFESAKGKPRERFLDTDEITTLLNACDKQFVKLWTVIALSTAARSGAILGLTCDRVNFADSIIDFRDPTIEGRHKPRSVIKMPQSLRPYLKDAVSKSVSGFVVEKNGRPIETITYEFGKAVKMSGLKDVTPHILRHTCAVHMVKAGVPIYEVSQYLGHKSVKITEDHYAKFSPDFMTRSSEVGSSLIAGDRFRVAQSDTR